MRNNINFKLLPMKGHYFLWNAGTAPVVPFMSVYAKQLGFSSFIVGIIYTILPFSGMLAKPLMGAIADKFKCQKLIFLIGQVVAAIAFLGMIFLPEVPKNVKSNIHFSCDNSEIDLKTCATGYGLASIKSDAVVKCEMSCPLTPKHWGTVCKTWDTMYCSEHEERLNFTAHVPTNLTVPIGDCLYLKVNSITLDNGKTMYPKCTSEDKISVNCDIKCDSHVINDLASCTKGCTKESKEDNVTSKYQFWLLLSVFLIAWIGQAVTVSIGDTICFQLLGDQPHKYGYQRMYGALGWGIFSIISGLLVDYFSEGETKKNYAPVFSIGIVVLGLCVIVSSQIKYTQQSISANILKDLGRLLLNLKIFIFVLWCICVGLCTALMWNFLFWLLEELAANHGGEMESWIKTIEGLVMGIQCLGGELPFFFLSSRILKKIGHVHAMSLVLLVFGLRFIFYSVITNPWYSLPIEFLNGLTFGLFYATMASYASIVAPIGTEATTQGLVGAVFEGIGVSLGSFIAGLLMQELGASMTFRSFGIFALIMGVLHACVQLFMQKTANKNKGSLTHYATPHDAILMTFNDTQELKLIEP